MSGLHEQWRSSKLEPLGGALAAALPEAIRRNLPGWRGVLGWAEAVGPEIARRSRALAYHDGRLTVQVTGSVWMHHLAAMKPQLLARVNRVTGAPDPVIHDIVFVVDPALAGRDRQGAA
jgi:predicted nucleic acid-binding Zn ribbon protein